MKTISLEVSDSTAEKINLMPDAEKAQISRLLDVWTTKPRPILEVMEEMGEYASKQGLTKEKLDELLNDK